jgi:hypothetical protein
MRASAVKILSIWGEKTNIFSILEDEQMQKENFMRLLVGIKMLDCIQGCESNCQPIP